MIVVGAIALIGTLSAQAQETKPSTVDKAWVSLNTAQLNLQLDLNDDQEAQVKEIDTRYIKQHQALEQSEPKLSDKDMSDKTAGLMLERDRELRKVLTPEQYAKWDAKRQKGTSDLTPEKKETMKD
jgi:periplasmic protein CpxP/Spy